MPVSFRIPPVRITALGAGAGRISTSVPPEKLHKPAPVGSSSRASPGGRTGHRPRRVLLHSAPVPQDLGAQHRTPLATLLCRIRTRRAAPLAISKAQLNAESRQPGAEVKQFRRHLKFSRRSGRFAQCERVPLVQTMYAWAGLGHGQQIPTATELIPRTFNPQHQHQHFEPLAFQAMRPMFMPQAPPPLMR